MHNDHSIACRLTEPALAERMAQLREGIFATALRVSASEHGIAFSFANTDAMFDQLQQFVAIERQCCPFLTLELSIPPAPEPIVLTMPGDLEIRRFVRDTFVALVPGSIR